MRGTLAFAGLRRNGGLHFLTASESSGTPFVYCHFVRGTGEAALGRRH